MSKLIENPYNVLITLSAKIIYDLKIKEDNWLKVIEFVKGHVNANVKNEGYAIKLIKEQISEVDGNCAKLLINEFNASIDAKKCYFKLIDWILQINLKRQRLSKSVNKKTVAKHIIKEELFEANKHFTDKKLVASINVDKIIDVSINSYIKTA